MTRKALHAVLVAAMVLLAGCAGGLSGTPSAGDGATPGDGTVTGGSGTVDLYISDQPAAIEDFEHLNVTITSVGFQQAGADDGEAEQPENETDEPETAEPTNETEEPETETRETAEPENEAAESEADADETDNESGGWIEHEVDGPVVDLTKLRGANATLLGQFDVPNGNYTTVFVHVSAVEGTLENGESVNVKLPSQKLQIHERFGVENGSQVDFVFDIAVHQAGNSGKYILRPVISESGTDVPIERVDEFDEDRPDAERDGDDELSALNASFVGAVSPGENATIEVTSGEAPVENASVFVDGERIDATNADGRVTVAVPDGEEFAVTIHHGESEVELEREFEPRDDRGDEQATTADSQG